MTLTREELAALQTVVDLAQSMCDTLETIHRNNLCMFDAEGAGSAFIVTPQDVTKHGAIIMPGSFRVDIEGWHRSIEELTNRLPDLRVPWRPYRPDTTLPEEALEPEPRTQH